MTTKRTILVTNALPYANGPLHLGHLVGTIQSDIWVRFNKMLGHDCLYICGSDSHGTPIMIQAQKLGITPEQLVSQYHQEQLRDFKDFSIGFDNYYTTNSAENEELVNFIFAQHQKKGNISKRKIKQLYDPVKAMFLPDRYIKGECPRCGTKDQYGDNCEHCGATYAPTELKNYYSTLSGVKPVEKESEHYFFQLEHYNGFLHEWTRQGHLQEQVINKLDEWFKEGLREWDISRDAPYFGFLIPGEKSKYFYVWLDAPVGYMASFKNFCEKNPAIKFDDYWGSNSTAELYHFIGKDIIYFHALFWPAILQGADFRTPSAIFVNGFLTIEGQKMSKSRGTYITARTYLEYLPPEYLRYYFAAKLNERIEDLDINFDDFSQRVNSDLVGKYVNIASRCASFINTHFAGQLAKKCVEPQLFQEFSRAGDDIADKWAKMEFSQAIRQIMTLADRANQYIDEKKPWALIKNKDQNETVQAVCTMGLNFFRLLTIYLKPVLPKTAEAVEHFLNIPALTWDDKNKPLINHKISDFKPLMSRIDSKQIAAMKQASKPKEQETMNDQNTEQAAPTTNTIGIEQFNTIDLRVAKIIMAEEVEGADKLLQLKVDIGGGETKRIFAGIKSAYKPEELIGRHVVVVANLTPRQMRFGISEGMVLVASAPGGGKDLWIVSPDPGAEAGMKVK